ncbi:MAG: alpha/beta hydrolase [Leptospiraceae bacterium]|nr:alpha/beta hydrolase [Leptospiraceae bacterium]
MSRYFSKTLWQSVLGMLIFISIGSAIVYRFAPRLALSGIEEIYKWNAGLSRSTADLSGYKLPYLHGGSGPALLLIHGYGDSRRAFVQSAAFLQHDYTLILPDLPGFGDSPKDPKRDYSIARQALSVVELMDALSIPSAYLVGNSMGGHICAYLAIHYPKRVQRLILLNPAGLLVDDPIPYKAEVQPLRSRADFEAYLDDVFVNKPWVPEPFIQVFLAESEVNFKWQNFLRAQIRSGEGYILNDQVGRIQAPTLIFWGRQDGVINVVHAAEWHQRVKNSQLKIWDDMGHAPQYEDPARTAELIRSFLSPASRI